MMSSVLLVLDCPARAAPPESLSDLMLHPLNSSTLALRYESGGGGFLISRDGGRTFSITPSRSFSSYEINSRIPMIVDSEGRLLFGTLDGLFADDKAGCVQRTPEMGVWVTDFALHPTDPQTLFLVTTGNNEKGHVGVWRRDLDGTLTPLGASEPLRIQDTLYQGFLASGLRVAPHESAEGKLRFLEVGNRYTVQGGQQVTTPAFRFSDDSGARWVERALPGQNGTTEIPRLLAVDGSSPSKIVIAIEIADANADKPDLILVSVDGGQNFASYLDQVTWLSAAVLLPDGRFLLGDRGPMGGLWLAPVIGAPLQKVYDTPIRCLGYDARASRLYACKRYEFGVLDLETSSFCSQFQMNEVRGLSCPTFTMTQLEDVATQLCSGWCGPGHYAYSTLCARYDNAAQICGVRAHWLDQGDPDPQKRWVEPPGPLAAPRCAHAPPLANASVSAFDAGGIAAEPSAADASEAPDAVALADATTMQEPTETTYDAGGELEHDSGPPIVAVESAHGGGCQLASPRASNELAWWLGAFASTRFRRRRPRTRHDVESEK